MWSKQLLREKGGSLNPNPNPSTIPRKGSITHNSLQNKYRYILVLPERPNLYLGSLNLGTKKHWL